MIFFFLFLFGISFFSVIKNSAVLFSGEGGWALLLFLAFTVLYFMPIPWVLFGIVFFAGLFSTIGSISFLPILTAFFIGTCASKALLYFFFKEHDPFPDAASIFISMSTACIALGIYFLLKEYISGISQNFSYSASLSAIPVGFFLSIILFISLFLKEHYKKYK